MTRWQYLVTGRSIDQWVEQEALNIRGLDGWELVGSDSARLYFKRPVLRWWQR